MFDNGTIIQMSPALKNFTSNSEVLINPVDFSSIGITEGQPVTLINGEKKISVVVKPDERIPRSIAFGYLNQDGVDLRALISDGSESIDIRIDPTAKVI
jgi:formylmethanofuran dehydrogenase subunit D